jgi:hypothetical protein
MKVTFFGEAGDMVSSTFRETWKPAECLIPIVERELFSLREKDRSPMRHNLFVI